METGKTNREAQERIRDENAFLKMKLMLEHGAKFDEQKNTDLPPEIENMFLHRVAAFEEQLANRDTSRVYDIIGKPTHFRPAAEISDEDVHDAWNELKIYLNRYGIDLTACSPAVTERELYRFTIEELFEEEMIMMDLPGWRYNFIYDEFHPDPVYEATHHAKEYGMRSIFSREPFTGGAHFAKENIRLNLYHSLSVETLEKIINRFKEIFEDIILTSVTQVTCEIEGSVARVEGQYRAKCVMDSERLTYRGHWMMELEKEEHNWWTIQGMEITGIEF